METFFLEMMELQFPIVNLSLHDLASYVPSTLVQSTLSPRRRSGAAGVCGTGAW